MSPLFGNNDVIELAEDADFPMRAKKQRQLQEVRHHARCHEFTRPAPDSRCQP